MKQQIIELDVKSYGVIGAIYKAFNAKSVTNYCGLSWDKVPLRCDWLVWPGTMDVKGCPDFVATIDGGVVCFQYI